MKKNLPVLSLGFILFFSIAINAQWQKFSATNGNNITDVATLNNILFISQSSGGINISNDNGTTWTAANKGINFSSVSCLGIIGTNLVAGTGGGIFTTTDNGGSWSLTTSGFSYTQDFLAVGNKIFATVYDKGIIASSDNGLTWTPSNTGVSNISLACLGYTGSGMYAGGFSGNIFKSTDNGATWTALNTGMSSSKVSKLAYMPSGIFASQYGKGIYVSADNGVSWTTVNNGLTDLFVNSIAVSGVNIFAGTNNSGIFISSNNGTKWSGISNGLTDLSINNLRVIGTDLYACTSNGLWKRSITEILSGVEEKSTVPVSYSLKQNYPNPFNPSTVISYQIPITGMVQLKVYDLLGQEIATLVNEMKMPGNYEVAFNGNALPSGIYFYKLSAGNFSETKKMMLIK